MHQAFKIQRFRRLFEEQLQRFCKIVAGVHPGVAAFGFFVIVFNAFGIEIFAVGFHVLIKEIVLANAIPQHLEVLLHILFGEKVGEAFIHSLGNQI